MKRLIFIALIQILAIGFTFAQGIDKKTEFQALQSKKTFLPKATKLDSLFNLFFHLKEKAMRENTAQDSCFSTQKFFTNYSASNKNTSSFRFINSSSQINKNISLTRFNLTDSLAVSSDLRFAPIVKIGKLEFRYNTLDVSYLYNDILLRTPEKPFTPEEEFFIHREVMKEKMAREKYDKNIDRYLMKEYSLTLIDFGNR